MRRRHRSLLVRGVGTTTEFACVTSGAGAEGDACDAPMTSAQCGDHLVCLATAGDATKATCVRWCDAAHVCPAGKTCTELITARGEPLVVCQ